VADINANIRVNLDTSQALASLRSLQSQVSTFNQSVIASNAQAVAAQRGMVSTLQAQIGATGQFTTSIRNVETGVSRLGASIDKGKLSMGEYFKYGVASSKNFGKVFRQEHEAVMGLATDRVKRLQTQYIALNQAQNGMVKTLAVRPMQLWNADSAISIQRQQIFNKLLRDGSTSLVNWGKNTQWAGRQLMVGFTIPLTIFGSVASRIFMDLEKQAINFRKVYGDIFTSDAEVEENLEGIRELSKEMTKYGIAVKDTMALAGVAAQAGLRGEDLAAATTEATRLAVLGQMEQTEAMRTIISMQTAFQQSNEQLAESVDFLNIIENQTVLSLQDVAGAIPRVAPVIKGMGGDVKDLAILLVAMREGGVSAAEGANALKNSLARLVDPTTRAIKVSKEFGINLEDIVERNRGEVLPTIIELAKAMGELEGPDEQKLLATVFGKFQYARIGALMKNIRDDSSQAARAMDLMGMSAEQLAETSEKELGVVEDAISTKFTAAMQRAQLAIAPIGEIFLKLATPILEGISKIFEKFNELSPTVKNFITILAAGVGIVAPVLLMAIGLLGNLIGNMAKGISTLFNFFTRIRFGAEAVTYLSGSQLDAAAAAASLEGQTNTLTSSLNIQADAVRGLAAAYQSYVDGARAAAASLPQGFSAPTGGAVPGGAAPIAMARGGLVPGSGNKDSVPALLMPGESVVTKEATEKFAPIISAMNAGTLQGFAKGMTGDISFGSLGTVSLSSIYNQTSFRVIQEMADGLENAGEDVRRAFMGILKDLSQTQNLTKAMVQEAVKSSTIPEIASLGSERRYTAAAAGERRSIEQQLNEDLSSLANSQELAEKELTRARAAANGAKNAINEYYDTLLEGATSQEQIEAIQIDRTAKLKSAEQIDRAHIVALENAEKMERAAWDARLWLPQSGVENQLSNMLASSEDNRAIYEQYLMNLSDSSITEEQRMQILDKIGSNLALTDSELDIQKQVLQNILADAQESAILVQKTNGAFAQLSDNFVPYAAGVIGAAEGRATLGPVDPAVEAERMSLSGQVIGRLRQDWRTGSPSEVAADVAQEVPRGVAKGIERGTPEAVAASKDMAKQVAGQLDLFDEVPKQAGEQLALLTRDEVKKAAEQIRPATGGGGGRGIGGFTYEPGMFGDPGNNFGKGMQEINKKFLPQTKDGFKKMGSALKNGSSKLTGLSMGLSSLTFMLGRTEGSVGEIAQKAMPVVLGLSSLQMVLPLLSNPLGLLIAGVSALVIGFKFLNDRNNAAAQKVADYSVAVDGAISSLKTFAEQYGSLLPSQRFRKAVQGFTTPEQEEAVSEARQFLQEGEGKKIVERVQGLSVQERFEALEAELLQAVAFEVLSPDQARSVALALGSELGSYTLGGQLVRSIVDAIGRDGRNIEDSLTGVIDKTIKRSSKIVDNFGKVIEESTKPLTSADLAFDLTAQGQVTESQAAAQGLSALGLPEDTAKELFEDVKGLGTEYEKTFDKASKAGNEFTQILLTQKDVVAFIGPAVNNLLRLSEAQDLVNLRYREGLMSLEEFNRLTGKTEEARSKIGGALRTLLEDAALGFAQFNDSFAKTLIALGKTPEEVSAIENQAREAAQGIATMVEKLDAKKLEVGLKIGLAEEEITKEEVASFYNSLSEDPNLKISAEVMFKDANEADTARIMKIFNEMVGLDPEIQKTIVAQFDTKPRDYTEINRLLVDITRFSGFPDLQAKAMEFSFKHKGSQESQQVLSEMEKYLQSIMANSQISGQIDFKTVSFEALEQANDLWDSLGKKKDITKSVEIQDRFSKVAKDFGFTLAELNKLPNIFKQAILLQMTVIGELNMKFGDLTLGRAGADPSDRKFFTQAQIGIQQRIRSIVDQARSLFESGSKEIEVPGGGTPEEKGGKSGGGQKEKSFLEQLIETIEANSKLYLNAAGGLEGYLKNRGKFVGLIKKLRDQGIPEDVISQIGVGPEAVKKAQEVLNATQAQKQKIIRGTRAISVGEGAASLVSGIVSTGRELRARKTISGESEEVQNIIMADQALVTAFASVKKGGPAYKKLIALVKQLSADKKELAKISKTELDIQEEINDLYNEASALELDGMQIQIDQITDDLYKAFEKTYGMSAEMMQHEITMRNHQIAKIQDQIDEIEKLKSAEQERIEILNRQIEMLERQQEAIRRQVEELENQKEALQRQLEVMERANEMDQRRIDVLRRQDEIRNRVAEAMTYELEIMSDQEEKIRQAHDKRIKALDKIRTINDRLIAQQQQQLNLSRAISEGDIYAATAAAQEMRASMAAAAQDTAREGMEEGLERRIGGLTTSEGLTREQVEERLRLIREQSRQTSLQIRDIEDQIYNRNLAMLPIKDRVYALDLQIRDKNDEIKNIALQTRDISDQITLIQDVIYAKDEAIALMKKEQLDPLVDQNTEQEKHLKLLQQEVDENTGPLKARFDALSRERALRQRINEQNIRLEKLTKKAEDAANLLEGKWSSVGTAIWNAVAAARELASIGFGASGAFAGGLMKYAMGGKVKKYGMGSIVGDGSRDSIAAMLTPGEFVVRKSMVDKYGLPMLEAINQGAFAMPKYSVPSSITQDIKIDKSNTKIDAPVYNNYDLKFSINGTSANADEIANKVMFKMKSLQDMQIRSNRGY
jgi:TP901 family phage tail tape measure protein